MAVADSGQHFWSYTVPAEPCPTGRSCFATHLLVRDRLADIPHPWTVELKVKKLSELDEPYISGIDRNGNQILVTHEFTHFATGTRVIEPNETSYSAWFTETLYLTFQHPRCADCMALATLMA